MSDAALAPAEDDADRDAPPETPIPNFSVKSKVHRSNGKDLDYFVITYGDPQRTIEIEPPTLGDRFQVAGIAPNASDQWVGTALAAKAIRTIDGTPYPRGWIRTKRGIRDLLVRLGYDGLRAINRALSSVVGDVEPEPEGEPSAPQPIPNFTAVSSTITMGKKTLDSIKLTFGEPIRTAEIVRPGLGEQFDLMEIAAAPGPLWTALAMAAMSVHVLDGEAINATLSENVLADLLDKLGTVGVRAINQALAPVQVPDQALLSPDEESDAADAAFKGTVGN